MAYALLVHAAAASTDGNTATTAAIDTTGANFIVLATLTYQAGGAYTVSDSKSNTWTSRTTYSVSGDPRVQLFYVYAPTVGSGHTFQVTLVTTQIYPSICVAAFSGSMTAPYDTENGATASSAVTSLATGSVTPSVDNDLLIAAVCPSPSTTAPTIGSGFTITDSPSSGGTSYGGSLAYLIQTTAAAVNPTWSFPSGTAAATQAAFKASTVVASAALTGTMVGGITESDVVSGGKVLTITLTDDTFIAV